VSAPLYVRVVRRLRGWRRRLVAFATGAPATGQAELGDLRRTAPLCDSFGFSRGTPVDRVYIDAFLARHAADIRGRVLEVKEPAYATRFGAGRVESIDVVDIDPANPRATVVADLADAPQLADDAYDAVVLTQTLQLIYRHEAALATVHRVLKPGGVLLITVPGVTTVGAADGVDASWCWSYTPVSLALMLEERFGAGTFEVASHGNVLAAVAFLEGLAAEELTAAELAVHDPDYPLVVVGRAVKRAGTR
jgi:SAM-dependent methyltransferase